SCFSFDGRRVADRPQFRVEENEYIEPQLTIGTAIAPRSARRRRKVLTDPTALLGQQQADDRAVLRAVEQLTRAGRYVTVDTGQAAAGTWAAIREAGLTPKVGTAAVERLLAAGKVERVEVRVLRDGNGPGRTAAGLCRSSS